MSAESPALAAWLQRIEQLHPSSIELGLARVGQVWHQLRQQAPPLVITVAGTNGKGSVCALLESMLRAGGYRVGLYTSPHLRHYCERVRIDGRQVDDAAMVDALAAVDTARGDISLTYFEFGTLAAFSLFQQQALDVWVLEVGMGGRLDAVNLIDADLAIITNIALDHVEWLGHDRHSIAAEKAGIIRAHQPVLFGESDIPVSLSQRAHELTAALYCVGQDFSARALDGGDWEYTGPLQLSAAHQARRYLHLPTPALPGPHQRGNASLAISALGLLSLRCPLPIAALAAGLRQVQLAGRFQILRPDPAGAEIILDVAHNAHGVAVLAAALARRPCTGRTHCVFSALQDKDLNTMLPDLAACVDEWWLAPLSGPRGRSLENLQQALQTAGIEAPWHGVQSLAQALAEARSAARAEDRIVVCGSFLTVAAAAEALD